MSRNIKEIGKELLGKSLNSYHRKTGLTQLEENNKMQDGILDGILSQVDDAYIEKTEQSNVIHLDGSGDGVVVLDGIEGNTMVNLANIRKTYINHGVIANDIITLTQKDIDQNYALSKKDLPHKIGEKYTVVINVIKNTCSRENSVASASSSGLGVGDYALNFSSTSIQQGFTGVRKILGTTREVNSNVFFHLCLIKNTTSPSGEFAFQIMVLEGDWTNREIPASYFEGLQSSFEEQVEDNKYKIEILSNNKNLFDYKQDKYMLYNGATLNKLDNIFSLDSGEFNGAVFWEFNKNLIKKNKTITFSINVTSCTNLNRFGIYIRQVKFGKVYVGKSPLTLGVNKVTVSTDNITDDFMVMVYAPSTPSTNENIKFKDVMLCYGEDTNYIQFEQNKIKLLLNEPLRGTTAIKDKLVIKDSKLMIERNYREIIFNGTQRLTKSNNGDNTYMFSYMCQELKLRPNNKKYYAISDKLPYLSGNEDVPHIRTNGSQPYGNIVIYINKSDIDNTTTNEYFKNNPIKAIFNTLEPYYEEVLNEYGEPIILEGYENGTLYINSTVIPTTTVRYTPKMESFKTLKEVENNNIMLTNDVNNNIIPYMMDVDLMIMEKEMALMSHKNIRKMEVLDMTSMQKRTQDMLERLIKGKTLTEQECKTRVTTYLNAGKITDAQAEELNFLIDEIYA